jgi:ABC-type sugar transport system substrate-binding protein
MLMSVGAVAVTACGSSSSSTTVASGGTAKAQASSGKKCTFGYSAPYLNNPAVAVAQTLAVAQAKADGLHVLSPTNANNDPAQQFTNIQTLVSEGANCVIVDPVDSKAIIPAINYLAQKHVTTVGIDIGADGGKLSIMVRADNVTMASQSCEALAKALHGKGTVLEMRGNLSDLNGQERDAGFQKCIKKYPGITVIEGEQTLWDPQKAQEVAADELRAHANITGVFMASDGNMWAGVMSSLKAANRLYKIGNPKHVVVTGIDGTPAAFASIRQGYLDGTVEQPFNLYAKWGLYYLGQAFNGATFHTGPTNHDSNIIRFAGNLVDVVPATYVDKANVNSPQWWGNQVGKTQ